MKFTLLLFLLCGILVSAVQAQTASGVDANPQDRQDAENASNVLNQQTGAEDGNNGYQRLVTAGKQLLPGENGRPSTADRNLTPAENLRRQRVAVARNAPALKLLRQALQMPIEVPAIQSQSDLSTSFGPKASFRELARQLRQESDVRLADGDAAGALDSRLTTLELGAAITRGGSLIDSLVGAAIEAIGRQNMESIVAKADAPSLRAARARLQAVEARRATFPQVIKVEKSVSTLLLTAQMEKMALDEKTRPRLATLQGREEMGLSEAEVREMLTLTPAVLTAQVATVFDAILARDQLPYARALRVVLPTPPSKSAQALTELWRAPGTRFSYERNLAASRLLQAALELRALKLERGAYPATIEAPLDPFGENEPLVYERKGNSYLLYSIGPDLIDNGGRPIQSHFFDPESGTTQISRRIILPTSRGDILAPVF